MKASLYIRVKMPDGKYVTTKPAFGANGRIRPQVAMIDDKPERFDSATYVLRYVRNGKAAWETVGSDPQVALSALDRKNFELQGRKLGYALTVPVLPIEAKPSGVADPGPSPKRPTPEASASRERPLDKTVTKYLDEIDKFRKPKTYAAYKKALTYFQESCRRSNVEDIDRDDLMNFKFFLKKEKKQTDRSSRNKFVAVMTFLKKQGHRVVLQTGDWPKYDEEVPEIYEQEDLDSFFAACNPQERLWFEFFLTTGMRNQEVMHCTWREINFQRRTVSVKANAEYNWEPKTKKGREIPVPAFLLESLRAIKPADSRRLIFPTSSGRPKGNFWLECKAIAERAELDPADWWLHKFRATFATKQLRAGVDIRTVQAWMGHSPKDLKTIMRYLRPAEGDAVHALVNAAFAGMRGAA